MPAPYGVVHFTSLVIRENGVTKHDGAGIIDFVGATVTKSGDKAIVTITGTTVTEVPKLVEEFNTTAGTNVWDIVKLTGIDTVESIASNNASEIPNGVFGVVLSKPTSILARVLFVGIIGGQSGLTTGNPVFVQTDGTMAHTIPTTGMIQQIGFAVSTTEVFIYIQQPMEQI